MFEPTNYEIVIRGRANARILRPLLDDFVCDHTDDGQTHLVGEVHDPAHLHGVVAHLTAMNAELISIAPLGRSATAPVLPTLTPNTRNHDNPTEWTSNS